MRMHLRDSGRSNPQLLGSLMNSLIMSKKGIPLFVLKFVPLFAAVNGRLVLHSVRII
jgi:hypothetical protein